MGGLSGIGRYVAKFGGMVDKFPAAATSRRMNRVNPYWSRHMPSPDPVRNKILERLPKSEFQQIMGLMEKVSPEVGEVVAHPGMDPKFVHFPVSGVLSSMVVLENGSTVEASTIGNEGMDGLYLLADPLANPYRINVQVRGEMFRMSTTTFKRVRRAGLEEASCECFRVTSQMYERMMKLS
jgi:hypothetical protein